MRIQAVVGAETNKNKPSKKRKRQVLFQPNTTNFIAVDANKVEEDLDGDTAEDGPKDDEVIITEAYSKSRKLPILHHQLTTQ